MINEAQRRGVAVIVASLPPQNPEGSRGNGAEDLPEFSPPVGRLAADEDVIFLDLYLMGTYVGYIGVDGLHPTPTGYQKIAEFWQKFSAISRSPAIRTRRGSRDSRGDFMNSHCFKPVNP